MKNTMKLAFAALAASTLGASAASITLGNASLDSAIVGNTWTEQTTNWQAFPGRASAGGITTISLATDHGTAYGSLFSTGTETGGASGDSIYQNVALTSGQLYEMSISVATSSDDTTNTTAGVFAIAVYTSGFGAVLAESAHTTVTAGDNTWQDFTFQFTADADANFNVGVRNFTDSVDGDATVYVDNIRLDSIPEPSSAALLGLGGLALILRRRK